VEHKLFGGQSEQRVGARISSRSRSEYHGNKRSKRASIGCRRPRDEVFDVLALGRGQNGEEKCCRWLTSVARGGDDAQRALSDPAAAALVAKHGAPPAATNDLSGRAPAVRDRAGAHDEENSRAVVERIVHRDQAIRIDDDFFRQLPRIESGMERATLLVPPCTGDATVQNAREHSAWLCNLRERLSHELRDDVG